MAIHFSFSSMVRKADIGLRNSLLGRLLGLIFLGDEIDQVVKKIKRAYSGGQSTVEEHRRLGGNPDVDVAYQYMMYFFEDDDEFLQSINSNYRAGKILAGEMKQLCIDRATEWLSELHEKRSQNEHLVNEFLASDAI